MRGAALALLLAAPALAGCMASTSPVDGAGAEPAPAPVAAEFAHETCRLHFGRFPLPPGAAEPFLPAGFTPWWGDLGVPESALQVAAFACDALSGAGGSAYGELWWFIEVLPPESWRKGPDRYWAYLGILAEDPVVAGHYASWGLPWVGTADVEAFRGRVGSAVSVQDSAASDAATSVALRTVASGPLELPDVPLLIRGFAVVPSDAGAAVVAAFDLDIPPVTYAAAEASFEVAEGHARFPSASGHGIGAATLGTIDRLLLRRVPLEEAGA